MLIKQSFHFVNLLQIFLLLHILASINVNYFKTILTEKNLKKYSLKTGRRLCSDVSKLSTPQLLKLGLKLNVVHIFLYLSA